MSIKEISDDQQGKAASHSLVSIETHLGDKRLGISAKMYLN